MAASPIVRVVQVVDLTAVSGIHDARERIRSIRPGVFLRVAVDRSTWQCAGLPQILAGQTFRSPGIDIESEEPRVAVNFVELLRPHLVAMRADWDAMQTRLPNREAS